MTALSNSGSYQFSGFGNQYKKDVRSLESAKSSLEQAYSEVPQSCEEIRNRINSLIEELNCEIIGAEEVYQNND